MKKSGQNKQYSGSLYKKVEIRGRMAKNKHGAGGIRLFFYVATFGTLSVHPLLVYLFLNRRDQKGVFTGSFDSDRMAWLIVLRTKDGQAVVTKSRKRIDDRLWTDTCHLSTDDLAKRRPGLLTNVLPGGHPCKISKNKTGAREGSTRAMYPYRDGIKDALGSFDYSQEPPGFSSCLAAFKTITNSCSEH